MPRQKVEDPNEMQLAVDVRSVHRGPGRPKKDENDDPRTALAVGVVQEPARRTRSRDQLAGSDRATLFARALVANMGQPIPALAAAYGISVEEADRRAIELHADIRSHSRAGLSLQELLERHDLTSEVRLAVLREALFSPQAAVRLKAVEMIDEVDMTAKSKRIGSSWDDIVRIAKDRAMRKRRK